MYDHESQNAMLQSVGSIWIARNALHPPISQTFDLYMHCNINYEMFLSHLSYFNNSFANPVSKGIEYHITIITLIKDLSSIIIH